MVTALTQPPWLAVIDIVAIIGDDVLFTAVKAETLPVPLAGSPMAVFEFVQEYVTPEFEKEASTARVLPVPPQGSPNTPLLAPMVAVFCPIKKPETTLVLFDP